MDSNLPIVVAVSGTGRSLKNLIQVQDQHCYKIVGVITSHSDSPAAKLAGEQGLPLFDGDFPSSSSFSSSSFSSNKSKHGKAENTSLLQKFLCDRACKLVVLAGFIRLYPAGVAGIPAMNIHPSLLPSYGGCGFYGLKVHAAVLEAGEKVSGVSCHKISEEYDEGDILSQVVVKVSEDDTPQSLAARVFEWEKKLLPLTIDFVLSSDTTQR